MASRKPKPASQAMIIGRLNKQLSAAYASDAKQARIIRDLRATVITLTKQIEAAKKPWWRVWWK